MASSFRKFAAGIFLTTAILLVAGIAAADEFRGSAFTAEAWFGPEGALAPRYRLYVGAAGYRLESIDLVEGPDIIIAQFAAARFAYIDRNTGAVNYLPMGENHWGRFHGVACADFEYRQGLGAATVAGRATEIWQCIGSTRYLQDTKIWWDPALKYQIRPDEDGYITELRDIRPGEPDFALFQIPDAPN